MTSTPLNADGMATERAAALLEQLKGAIVALTCQHGPRLANGPAALLAAAHNEVKPRCFA